MPTLLFSAKTAYKKAPGRLQLTATHLQWLQDGRQSPAVNVPNGDLSSLFCSKEGSPQVKIKISLTGDDNGFMFIFTSPGQAALAERESVKSQLTSIISQNRSTNGAPLLPPTAPTVSAPVVAQQNPAPSSTVPQSLARSPAPSRAASRAPSRAASIAPDPRPTAIVPGNDPAFDFQLRKRVLLGNRELGHLHRELVMSGQISEQEFWEGREYMLLAQAAQDTQKKGKPGQLVDPRPETVDGETKIRITPQLVRDIFEEYPVVQKAYSENVPAKMAEADFWRRYFQSKLFNAHRASIRSTAAQHVVMEDPILDQYLEKDDDGLEPRRDIDPDRVDMLVDLAATREDHEETGNEKDVTMQAGKQRGALPLIRKFNEHSERLLNSALGDLPSAKRRRIESSADTYVNDIALEDLVDPEASDGIMLEMKDQQRYFEGRSAAEKLTPVQTLEPGKMLLEAKGSLDGWENNLAHLKIDRTAGDAALIAMTHNVSARLEVKARKNDIPEALFQQMTTCQTAANEFLRQFWTSMYPPSAELHVPTPAQRTAKMAKMAAYLSNTPEKVQALVRMAGQYQADPKKVQTALQPLLNSVDRALTYHQTKTAPRS